MPSTMLPPPSSGWNTRDPVTMLKAEFAPVMDNFVIEGGVPRVRRGWRAWSTGLPGRVDGLLSWSGSGTAHRLFAASGAGIYDVTAGGAVGAAAVTGLTSARWDGIMVAAAGANRLLAFNGVDVPQVFDGTTWAPWAGTGVTGGVAWAGTVAGRLFVGNPTRLSFFYGAAGAITGTFAEFPLQGVASRGGGVVAMGSISSDGGGGPRSLTVFVTSEGEAIVYTGTDPTDVATWGLVGRWRLPRPLGAPHRCVAAWGGDLLLLTDAGIVPLSALSEGSAATLVMERVGPVRRVAPSWMALAEERTARDWSLVPLTRFGLLLSNVPWGPSAAQQVVVSEGQAVTRWAGIPAACWAESIGGRTFCGDASAGRVLLWGEDVADGGAGIIAEAVGPFTSLGRSGAIKRSHLMQAVLRDGEQSQVSARMIADWTVPLPLVDMGGASAAPSALQVLPGSPALGQWDVGLWDQALWAGEARAVSRSWIAAPAVGHALAPRITIVSGLDRPSWLGTNIAFETGGPMR